jgi:hypothetical protein
MADGNDTILNFDDNREPWTFLVLLIITIPGLAAALLILSYFFSQWNLMITKALYHHAVFLLIMVSFLYMVLDLPFNLSYFHVGYFPVRSVPFCLWWYWSNYSLLAISGNLVATASVQRHIVIFRSQWLQIGKSRWMLHYMPLICSVCYPPLYYIVLMFLYPCTVYFDITEGWCAYPCYLDSTVMYNIDWALTTILPVFIIVLGNVALLIRVIVSMKRIRQQQRGSWKRQKKLTLQLFSFSSLYFFTWFPMTVVALLHSLFLPNLYDEMPNLYYIYNLSYFVCPLQSLLCIFSLPELVGFIKRRARLLMTRMTVVPSASVQPTT